MKDTAHNDWDLFACAATDEASLAQLFDRHRHYVFRVAWGILNENAAAEDVVQEVFLRMRAGRLKAKPKAKFTTWLFKVAINTAREQARKRRRVWGDAAALDVLSTTEDGRADPARFDRLSDLGRSLAKLPLRQREVVVLRFLEGFGTAETAEILGCRAGTVKAHLHRATLKLRGELGNQRN
ncbi:MAG: RNA polymerase sigma factor [Rhodobacter sp.]|nr:RNA polymerase sigma factor [Rhodobacter sp.]